MEREDPIVNEIDEISDTAQSHDHTRTLDEYSPTNMPLSESEIKQDEARDTGHAGWVPRTTGNIGDLKPLPDPPAVP